MTRVRRAFPDPFATVTMAEILLEQGYWDKALKTAKEALERRPDDPRAADMVSFLSGIGSKKKHAKKGTGVDHAPVEGVGLSIDPSGEGVLSWRLDPSVLSAAAKRAGPGARQVGRIFWLVKGHRGPIRRTRDIFIEGESGRADIGPLPQNRMCGAAVGWLNGRGVFVAAAHSAMESP